MRILKNTVLFLLFFTVILGEVNATTPDENFKKGNEAFEAGNYSEAVSFYENILNSGQHSGEVYFNLGNAYFESGKIGKATLNYERAVKLSSGSADFLKNLEIARSKAKDEIEPLPPFFVSEFFANIRDIFSIRGWAIFTLLFLWVGLSILSLKNLGKKIPLSENLRRPVVMLSLSLASLGLLLAFAKNHHEQNFKEAIILVKKVGLKEAADAGSPNFLMLHEGTKVELTDKIGEWLKVRLADGDEGWLNEKDLEVI